LLINRPRRLSVDIDIIVDPGSNIDEYIRRAGKIFPFANVEEHKRQGVNDVEKRHFKFHFLSPRNGKEINILLDVVFGENPYPRVFERPIRNGLLVSAGDDYTVTLPDKNCILGDKLTAFAPHTIGIPFGKGKELEIVKQMFDCWTLIQEADDYNVVRDAYDRVSNVEIGYRGLDASPADCLKDTIDCCVCVMGRGSVRPNEYKLLSTGIGALQGHLFSEKINGENAGAYASEVAYLAACLLTGQTYERIEDPEAYRDVALKIKGIKKISGVRNTNPVAYAHMVKSFQILLEAGIFKDIEL
ncbi:MAG: nucleotidyl transferase AbiEii/AbiGii toxin family protein, partial [Thermoguttaceae bacterium]|nr:nucleotidyl transferase AbiEii/AbiGii toxin family protein [Thermoguttaceae bacterium]